MDLLNFGLPLFSVKIRISSTSASTNWRRSVCPSASVYRDKLQMCWNCIVLTIHPETTAEALFTLCPACDICEHRQLILFCCAVGRWLKCGPSELLRPPAPLLFCCPKEQRADCAAAQLSGGPRSLVGALPECRVMIGLGNCAV